MSCSIKYEIATGRLRDYTSPASTTEPEEGNGMLLFGEGVSSSVLYSHYVNGTDLVPRPVMPIVYTSTGEVGKPWTISQIPTGTEVKYPNGSIVVDDGYIEWYSAVPGEFLFTLTNFPYLDITVNATIT